jgi:hypothetical protein
MSALLITPASGVGDAGRCGAVFVVSSAAWCDSSGSEAAVPGLLKSHRETTAPRENASIGKRTILNVERLRRV